MGGADSGAEDVNQHQQMVSQFRAMGVPEDQLQDYARKRQAASAGSKAGAPECAAHLWPAVELAFALRTQLRCVAGPAGPLYLGLDYARMDGTKRDLGLPMRGPAARVLLRHFRFVESEMMNVLNERVSKGPRSTGGNTARRKRR